MDDILEIAAPRKGGKSNILQLNYTASFNKIIAKLTKAAAWFSLVWRVSL